MARVLGAQTFDGWPTPDDYRTVDLSAADVAVPETTIGLLVGGAGNLVVRCLHGDADVTIVATAGAYIPGRFSTVRKVGTTATGILAAVMM